MDRSTDEIIHDDFPEEPADWRDDESPGIPDAERLVEDPSDEFDEGEEVGLDPVDGELGRL
ncbi:hypothetical protein [Compostimonas suwonensis]|nr:hypothetical protein [Compostimonas suwonensis]